MPMVPFFEFLSSVARSETGCVKVVHDGGPVPRGEYGLVELYCNEPGCDCENVMINVMDARGSHLATINHSLDRRWNEAAGMPPTFLDPFNVQGPHASGLLGLFKDAALRDATYTERLKRHRAMVREVVQGRSARPTTAETVRSPRSTRNAPCPCGSGRKYKKCCGLVTS